MSETSRCPICSKAFDPEAPDSVLPFCGRRCQQIDLGQWLDEAYGLPADGNEDQEDVEPWRED